MFKEERLNDIPIIYLGDYHKYRINGLINSNFDVFSGHVLDVKELKEVEINNFANQINNLVEDNIALCYVPSCNSDKTDSGIRRIAKKLTLKSNRTDATECIVRHTTIEKLATGGNRHITVHLQSLKIINPSLIKGRNVLVLDDVTTSHNSLLACKQLLLEAGANEVHCLALGHTVAE